MAADRGVTILWVATFLGCLRCIAEGGLTSEWTSWTDWSRCSRTCGGGISSQHRRCTATAAAAAAAGLAAGTSGGHCKGQAVRYRVCALQDCLEVETDQSSQVCSALTSILPNGTTLSWLLKTKQDDCLVVCSPAVPSQIGNDDTVNLAEKDGTKCSINRPSSSSSSSAIGFCLSGKCRAAGCDSVLGSTLELDRCGVCGGDGSSCPPDRSHEVSRFQWQETGYTLCSVSCGSGEQQSIFSCKNLSSKATVPDDFCPLAEKPITRKRFCHGTNCADSQAVWITDEWKECSRTCDAGLSLRSVYCVLELDDGTFERTSETLCRFERKPVTERKCNEFECPRWFAGQWSHCSVSCGTGIQQRAVVCKRSDTLDCDPSEKPTTWRTCQSRFMCYHHTGPNPGALEGFDPDSDFDAIHGGDSFDHLGLWGNFDSSRGIQHFSDLERGTEVAEHVGSELLEPPPGRTQLEQQETLESQLSTELSQTKEYLRTVEQNHQTTELRLTTVKPTEEYESQQTTESPKPAEPKVSQEIGEVHETTKQLQTVGLTNETTRMLESTEDVEPSERTVEPLTPRLESAFSETDLPGPLAADDDLEDGSLRNESRTDDADLTYDEYDTRIDSGIDGDEDADEERKRNTEGIYRGGPPVERKAATTVPSFIVLPWGECSTTCGTGIKTRKVACQVLLEPTKDVKDLPDLNCEGPKPSAEDYCILKKCSVTPSPKVYAWVRNGYGPCSKSCAGGLKEAEFSCVRIPGYYKVEKIRCLRQTIPARRPTEPCNPHPCPPRWNPLAFGPCSLSCGGGQQFRQLQCLQENSTQTTRVQEGECKDPAPPTVASCNLIPCPAKWTIGDWSNCSATCGQGIQTRSVKCEQKLSANQNQSVDVDEVSCWQQMDKPETEKICEKGKCHAKSILSSTSSAIVSEKLHFVQVKPLPQVPLLVGTNASVIAGTSVTIHCPLAKDFSRLKVTWKRNDKVIEPKKRRRIRIDKHGSLRIRNARPTDKGVYSCSAGHDSANVTIRFHEIAESLGQLRLRQNLIFEEEEGEFPYSEDFMKSFLVEVNKLFARSRKASFSGRFLLNRMPSAIVPLQYVSFYWSPCSAECGGAGIQSRDVVCGITADEFLLDVDEGYCADRRILKPIADRDCGFEMCPHWEPGIWTECSDEACSAVATGQRRRPLFCISPSGQQVDAAKCKDQPKPKDVEDCPHDNCQAVWRPSSWTQCSVTCGDNGFKTRSFQCVWRSNKRSAGALCRIQERPASRKPCITSPCPETGCRDESKYCQMIPVLQLCRYQQYRQECCHSCSHLHFSNPTETTLHPPR